VLDALDDDALTRMLMHATASSLQTLACTSHRLRAATKADSLKLARIRAGIASIEIQLDLTEVFDADVDEDGFPLAGVDLEGEAVRHFKGAVLVDAVTAGKFSCTHVDRTRCYFGPHGFFLECDTDSQELVDIGGALFGADAHGDAQLRSASLYRRGGMPSYGPLMAEAADFDVPVDEGWGEMDVADEDVEWDVLGGLLYINEFVLTPACQGGPVPVPALAEVTTLAIKALLNARGLFERWEVAAYIGDPRRNVYRRGASAKQRRVDDCRPFVQASFDELEREEGQPKRMGAEDGGWLYTTKSRLHAGTVRVAPLRAEARGARCSAEPASLDNELLEAVLALQHAATAELSKDEFLEDIRKRIAAGASLDRAHALHGAVSVRQPALLQALVQLGADVNFRDACGLTPLMVASHRAFDAPCSIPRAWHAAVEVDTICIDALLELGADVSLIDPTGCSALGCYREAKLDAGINRPAGAGFLNNPLDRDADLAVEARLTPAAGPTSADANK